MIETAYIQANLIQPNESTSSRENMNLNNTSKKESFSHVPAIGQAYQNYKQYLNIQEIRKHNFQHGNCFDKLLSQVKELKVLVNSKIDKLSSSNIIKKKT